MSFNLYNAEGTGNLSEFTLNPKMNDPALYKPSQALINAVNVALALGQPLLLTGEPGTGKTQLAFHIAHFFNLAEPLVFNAQTTSTASDLFYRYDTLGHFQFSQNKDSKILSPKEVEDRFIEYVGLGKAIEQNRRRVVLIDEIDKAPRDLPNDVLAAVEDLEFKVPLVKKVYKASKENRPIIIITSNSEKNLPDAFLRRVVYYHIPFPKAETLLKILESKVDGFKDVNFNQIIKHFEGIRDNKSLKLKKKPATAELIFWTMLLQKLDFDTTKLENVKGLEQEDKQKLLTSYSVLAKNKDDLLKLEESIFGKKRSL